MRTDVYFSPRQRRNFIRSAQSNGETMIHDNHFSDRKELVFDIQIIPENPVFQLRKLLLGKLRNNTITFEQLKTLIRIEHGFELTQTTRDKILIAIQGVIGTLRDRLKSVFGL